MSLPLASAKGLENLKQTALAALVMRASKTFIF
jgi:hypothetical protein